MRNIFAVDSSVIVKWFKKGEEHEAEALRLQHAILSLNLTPLTSELASLEVTRALLKVGYETRKVEEAYKTLSEMYSLGFLTTTPLSTLKDAAKA